MRRRVRVTACALIALAGAVAVPHSAAAQGNLSKEGALFLIFPIGARAVGMGQSVGASQIGSEGLWWNPASLARMDKSELSLSHSSTISATGDAVTYVRPSGRIGVISFGGYLLDYGKQDAGVDANGITGTFYPRSVVAAVSYAAAFGSRVSAGVTYKFVQDRVDCSGSCGNVTTFNSSTSGLDLGLQAVVDPARRITIGIALRNAGLKLQINDNPQADPLPTRIDAGVQVHVPRIDSLVPGGELLVTADMVGNLSLSGPSFRSGAEFVYQKQFFLRAGFSTGSFDGAGAAIGLGLRRGGIAIDFARSFGGLSADAGKPPTFITLRFQF